MTIASLSRLAAVGLAAACVAACAASTDSADPSANTVEPIIGGDVDNGDPAVGVLKVVNIDGVTTFCSGSLISPDVVLTAGHCTANTVLGFFTGTGTPSNGQADFPDLSTLTLHDVDDWTTYVGYDAHLHDCPSAVPDLGLVHLKTSLTTTTPLHYGGRTPAVGDSCTLVGYGATMSRTDGDGTQGQRRSGTMTVEGIDAVDVHLAKGTGFMGKGDSGGPFLCGGSILAATSCNTNDGITLEPNHGYATRVDGSAVTSWIAAWVGFWPHYYCYDYTVCVLHGHEVVPGPDDDPNTWCTDVGGTKRKKTSCQYSGQLTQH